MKYSSFTGSNYSHEHSLETLNLFYEHDDFMESVGRLADLGCGQDALDLEWWATRTTRDEENIPLNIQCVGIDNAFDSLKFRHSNVSFQKQDLETLDRVTKPFDILWCHDTFQYLLNPLQTLANWRKICHRDGMLVLILPQTTNLVFNRQEFNVPNAHYYHYTVTNLLYMLAVTGWDCANGFFKKDPGDPWLHAIVYNTDEPARDPRKTGWYDLLETDLLPESAKQSINRHGYIKQADLILPWLDKSLTWMEQQ